MAHRASHSTSRISMDASFVDTSVASLVAPSETGSESFSEASGTQLGLNKNAVAYLVYHDRGDPRFAGYKQPTTRDIPQVKLPRVEAVNVLEVEPYLKELRTFERQGSPDDEAAATPPPLDSVPAVFFDADFHLDNPRVFDAVMGEDSSVLQEKLSWYVDIVEAHLEKQIAASSSQFFSATASFHAIEDQAAGLSQQIAAFKAVISGIQSGVVAHFEQTAKLQTRLRDLDTLLSALAQLQEFTHAVDSIASQDPAAVLDHVAAARSIATQGIDLRRVNVTHQHFDKLTAAENQARSDAASQLVSALLADTRADEPHPLDIDAALTLTKHADVTDAAIAEYARVIDGEIRVLVRKQLPGATDDESQGLARSLHTLSANDAEKMCENLFASLSKTFERLQNQPIPFSIIQNAVSGADSRLARVLRVRKDPATTLSVTQFERFFLDVTKFCDKCESLAKLRPTELSEFLVAQTKLYIHTLHSSSDETLAAAMDSDDWRPSEIWPRIQAAVNLISLAGSMDPSQWELPPPETASTNTTRVVVDGQPYIVSKSTQTLVGAVVKYLQLVCVLPAVHVSDTAAALLELLRLFNHKAHHLILGFGAKATAGLKHISVKNLMLTSESLRLVHNLMSSVKRCTERHLSTSDTIILDSFDSTQQSYFDHRAEIESKLVKLMSDKVAAYARQIALTDWSVRQPEANRYIQGLMNDTTKVSRVAQEMLPQPLAQAIVAAIFSAYKPALLEAYGEVTVRNADEKENVLRDLRYFKAKEVSLNGQSRSGDVIYESVKMFVGPDVPFQEPDLATDSRASTALQSAPRASVESGLSVDSRQAFATAVAQGIAQAEVVELEKSADSNGVTLNNASKSEEVALTNGAEELETHHVRLDREPRATESTPEIKQEVAVQDIDKQKFEEHAKNADRNGLSEVRIEVNLKAETDVESEKLAEVERETKNEAAETERRAKSEAEAKRKAEVEAEEKRKAEAEAEAKQKAEAEAEEKRKAEAEAEAKRKAEAEAEEKRKAEAEAEAKRKAEAEAEAKRKAEAEAEEKRRAEAEAEEKRKAEAAEAEAKQKAEAEAEAKRRAEAEAEAKQKAEAEAEEKRKVEAEAEAKRKAEVEAEEQRKAEAEAEAKQKAEAEAEEKRKAEAEAEEKRKAVAEAEEKRKAEAEAEAKRKAEAAEAEARRKAEAEAEEKRKADAEAEEKRKAEAEAEAKRKAEAAEAEARRKAEAEAEEKRKADAEAEEKRKAEAEAEAKRKAEAEAEEKRKAEAEAEEKRKAEAEAEEKRKAEAEAEEKRKAEAEAEAKRRAEAEAEAKQKAEAEAEEKRKAEAEIEEKLKSEAEERLHAEREAEIRSSAKEAPAKSTESVKSEQKGNSAESSETEAEQQGEATGAKKLPQGISTESHIENADDDGKDATILVTDGNITEANSYQSESAAVPNDNKEATAEIKKPSAIKSKKKKNNKKKKHK